MNIQINAASLNDILRGLNAVERVTYDDAVDAMTEQVEKANTLEEEHEVMRKINKQLSADHALTQHVLETARHELRVAKDRASLLHSDMEKLADENSRLVNNEISLNSIIQGMRQNEEARTTHVDSHLNAVLSVTNDDMVTRYNDLQARYDELDSSKATTADMEAAYKRGHDDAMAERNNEDLNRKTPLEDMLAYTDVDIVLGHAGRAPFHFKPVYVGKWKQFHTEAPGIAAKMDPHPEDTVGIVGVSMLSNKFAFYAKDAVISWKARKDPLAPTPWGS